MYILEPTSPKPTDSAIHEAIQSGKTPREVAQQFGVSRATVYRANRRERLRLWRKNGRPLGELVDDLAEVLDRLDLLLREARGAGKDLFDPGIAGLETHAEPHVHDLREALQKWACSEATDRADWETLGRLGSIYDPFAPERLATVHRFPGPRG